MVSLKKYRMLRISEEILPQFPYADPFEKLFCLPAKCLNSSANASYLKCILPFECGMLEQETLLSPHFAQNICPLPFGKLQNTWPLLIWQTT